MKWHYEGFSQRGSHYRLIIDINPYDLNYHTPLSPPDRIKKLAAVRKAQRLADEATTTLNEAGISQATIQIGYRERVEKQSGETDEQDN